MFPILIETDEKNFEVLKLKELREIQINNKCKLQNLEWLPTINVGSFVHVEFSYLQKIDLPVEISDIFTEDFLGILIIFSAIVFFMLATENRLFLMSKNTIDESQSFKIKSVFEKTLAHKVKKLKQFTFSQILHSKAIELLQCTVNKNKLYDDLVNSFVNNYETGIAMEQIQEEDENVGESAMSNFDSYLQYSFDRRNQQNSLTDFNIENYFLKDKSKQQSQNDLYQSKCIPNKVEDALQNINRKNQNKQKQESSSPKNNLIDKLFKKYKGKLTNNKIQPKKKLYKRKIKTPNGRIITCQKNQKIFQNKVQKDLKQKIKSTKIVHKSFQNNKNFNKKYSLFTPAKINIKHLQNSRMKSLCIPLNKNKQNSKNLQNKIKSQDKLKSNRVQKRMGSLVFKDYELPDIFRTYQSFQKAEKKMFSYEIDNRKFSNSKINL